MVTSTPARWVVSGGTFDLCGLHISLRKWRSLDDIFSKGPFSTDMSWPTHWVAHSSSFIFHFSITGKRIDTEVSTVWPAPSLPVPYAGVLPSESRATPPPPFCLSCLDLLQPCRLCRAPGFLHLHASMHIKWKLIVSFPSRILFWKVSASGEIMLRSNISVRATGWSDECQSSCCYAHVMFMLSSTRWDHHPDEFSDSSPSFLFPASTLLCVTWRTQSRNNPYLAIWHLEWIIFSAPFLHKS